MNLRTTSSFRDIVLDVCSLVIIKVKNVVPVSTTP
jgi:hypothetical protein